MNEAIPQLSDFNESALDDPPEGVLVLAIIISAP
jgi:hypothetical protein